MNVTKQQQQEGGYNQSQKIYHCSGCNGLGRNQRFVNHHLVNECDGKQKIKTAKCTKENQDRLQEAIINTKEWKIKKLKAETNILFNQFKSDAIRDIENMREINATVVEDMLKNYGGTFF
jgi:hypothetical protein